MMLRYEKKKKKGKMKKETKRNERHAVHNMKLAKVILAISTVSILVFIGQVRNLKVECNMKVFRQPKQETLFVIGTFGHKYYSETFVKRTPIKRRTHFIKRTLCLVHKSASYSYFYNKPLLSGHLY